MAGILSRRLRRLRGRPMGSGCPPSRPRRMILMGGAVWIRYLVLRSREVMSIWAVNWAFHTEVAPPVHKLVLVALANFADDEDLAWPHVETLAGMASVSTRTVQRALKALEEAGLIERSMGLAAGARGGLRRTNSVYRLNVPDDLSRRKGVRTARPGVVREFSSFAREDGSAVGPVGEGPSQARCAMGVTTVPNADEGPSQARCDTGVVTVDRCDTGDANRCDTGDVSIGEPSLVEPSDLTPLPPTPPSADGSGGVGSGPGSDLAVEDSRGGVGLPAAGSAPADGRAVSPNADGGVVPVGRDVAADWALIRHALPESMQVLDDDGVAVVAPLLRERLDAGWTAADLRAHLAGNPIPARVRHLAGLVAHRLSKLPPEGAPPKSSSRWRMPDPPSIPLRAEECSPVAVRAEAARMEAIRTGSPDAGRSRFWWLRRELDAAERAASEGMSGV